MVVSAFERMLARNSGLPVRTQVQNILEYAYVDNTSPITDAIMDLIGEERYEVL